MLYPTQPPCPLNGKPCPDFVGPDPAIYNSNAPFPATTATISNDATTFGYHIITINICPFEYLPKDKILFRFDQINITINYTIGTIEYTSRITEYRHELTQDYIKSMVQNPTAINSSQKTANQIVNMPTTNTDKLVISWQPSLAPGNIPNYIVITNNALKNSWKPFVQYKMQRGIPTVLVTVEDIYANYPGLDNQEKIRNYLKKAYDCWSVGLFVLLGGDTAVVPGRIGSYFRTENNCTDLYYSDVFKPLTPNYNWDGNNNGVFGEAGTTEGCELGAEYYVGRAPVDEIAEVDNFINKVIAYEKMDGVPNSERNYVNNMLFLGSYYDFNHTTNLGVGASAPTYNTNGTLATTPNGGQQWHFKLAAKPFLANSNLKKWLLFDDYLGNISTQVFPGNDELRRTTTLGNINNGHPTFGKYHLISHLDHGFYNGIGTSSKMKGDLIYREDMDDLNNGSFYQIMYSTSCESGWFQYDCFAEHYINAKLGGGVAYIGNSGSVSTGAEDQDTKLFESIYGNLPGKSYIMGLAFAKARDAVGDSSYSSYRPKQLTLFGDPTMATWGATPQNITLTVQPSVTINNAIANVLPVTINALTEEATITLYKYNTALQIVEVYASQKLAAGVTTAQFVVNPDTVGNIQVMVTAHNYIPATANVNVLFPQAHLYVSGYSFVDENGNGFIEQGENVTLSINLTNSGAADITAINTVLSSNPMFAIVTNSTVTYLQVNAGQTVTLTGYTFTAGTNSTLSDFIELLLNITASGNFVHNDNFYLDLKNSVLEKGARTITVAGTPITSFTLQQEVDLDVAIKNIGNIATGALTATLTSPVLVNAGFVTIIDNGLSSYSSIGSCQEKKNAPHFKFKFIASHTGPKPFVLTLNNPITNRTWTFNFDLNDPLPPQITNFRYTSSRTEIKTFWNPIANIAGYNVYRSDNLAGPAPYVKQNDFLLTGSALYSDSNVIPNTIYYYKISVVTLLGNELPLISLLTNPGGLQGYKTQSSFDFFNSFPVIAAGNNNNNSAPTLIDVDNDGNKEIFVNYYGMTELAGKIMGFKNSGQEMFDIDSNPTSISGFATSDIALYANSAVGDIDNDGHAEVFSVGADNTYTTVNANRGKLYAFKTVDTNTTDNLNKPDKLWNDEAITYPVTRVRANPVLYDVDHNGFLDILVMTEDQKIYVYDKDKNIMPGWPIQVLSDTNNVVEYSQGQLAVADLDHDGKAEIAVGFKSVNDTKGAIYIWHHDGTPFTVNPFKEFASMERADSGIVFADIDNDLNLDILITTRTGPYDRDPNTGTLAGILGKIYAFKQDGTSVPSAPNTNKWNGVNTFTTNSGYGQIPRIAVGDLNHDGNLEVALGSNGMLYLFDKMGGSIWNQPLSIKNIDNFAPILADVDNDADAEIIFNNVDVNSTNKIYAYNLDKTLCPGFPLESPYASAFTSSPSVDDLDNDGKNEIVTTAGSNTLVYKTDGHTINNEWSSYRANPRNTGTYKEVCNNKLDLMVRDFPSDLGKEPDLISPNMWESPDIWIRQHDDGLTGYENAEYSTVHPNYAYVRVTNKSCVTTTGLETVSFHWAKAGTSFIWPDTWDGLHFIPSTNSQVKTGDKVGTLPIPVLQPGQSTVIKFPFFVPDPSTYAVINGNDPSHFCMIARIEAPTDMPIETTDLYDNVKNNNNLGWANFSVVNFENDLTIPVMNSALVGVGNPREEPRAYFLEIEKEDLETGKDIYDEAEVSIRMDDVLYNAWVRGGKEAQRIEATNDDKKKIVKGNHVLLDNILFNGKEMGTLTLKFNFLTKELTEKSKFVYRLIQKDAITGKILGGETYIIQKKPRAGFEADAGPDKIVDRNQPITISAVQINEPAIYNWYDQAGNLIFTGKDLQIANAVATKYKLEVISTIDGFKDYSEMEVTFNPNRLKTIVPNPVNENTKIEYNLENVTSAYLMVVSYYMNGGVSNNYILDINSSEKVINFGNYANGFYKLVLVANGSIVDSKIIFKQ